MKKFFVLFFLIFNTVVNAKSTIYNESDLLLKDSLCVLHQDVEGVDVTQLFKSKDIQLDKKEPSKEYSMKFGGYITTKTLLTDEKGKSTLDFSLRLLRLYINGYAFKDFYYRLQLEATGAPGIDKGPRILDAFIEWQKLNQLKIKVGQFKRCFGFENPMSPWVTGFGAFSQASNKLASVVGDYSGEHGSSGRDVGVQIQGDLFKSPKGRNWFHYQIGLYNGQGINHKDRNNHKDLIAGLWITPIKCLRIGGFGWNGKYNNETYKAVNKDKELANVDRRRWGVGVDYEDNWVFRTEYMQSFGQNVKNIKSSSSQDAWYATIGIPIMKKVKLFTRWDCFREYRAWKSLVANYGIAANYLLGKHLQFQLSYNFTNNRTSKDKYYNTLDLQIYAKF